MEIIKCDILIENCVLMTENYDFLVDVAIAVKEGKIIAIGKELGQYYYAQDRIDASNKLAMPGLIDGHTHLSQQLLRGMISDEYPIIYQRFNLPLESKLTKEDVELSVKLGCLEMIRAGTTAFADAGSTHMEEFVNAVEESGLRATVTRATSDKGDSLPSNMIESTKNGLKESESFFKSYHNRGVGRIKAWFQFRTLATCSDELIVGLSDLARQYQTGIHTHISEYSESVLYALQTHQMREIEYLDHLGVMGENLLAAHCLLISENDIHILKRRKTKVVHCPRSNLGKVVSKTPSLLSHGVSVGIGTDGTAHSGLSIFRELTAFRHSQIVTNGVPYLDYEVMNSRKLIELATMGSARALMQEDEIGSLRVGKKADIILVDLAKPHITPTHNLLNTLTEAVGTGDISDMIVDGKVLMRNYEIKTLDEEKIMCESGKVIPRINHINGWTPKSLMGVKAIERQPL
jgi:5-methylthioadenosine/S-adenosylhomocysteine deaminase